MEFQIMQGDCRERLKEIADASVDSVVCDPPYELSFMGKKWDSTGIAYDVSVWRECLRVLKPGGHLLAFGGSRTYHRLACAIEDAGFAIRDQIMWLYGSGFPKSLNVSKAIDAAAGEERERGPDRAIAYSDSDCWSVPNKSGIGNDKSMFGIGAVRPGGTRTTTLPSTDAAKQWDGWGTALKPAHEPIVLARKPLIGTVAENVLQHGTGGLNIDGCRVETGETLQAGSRRLGDGVKYGLCEPSTEYEQNNNGRWPSNFIHDGSPEVIAGFPETTSGSGIKNPIGGISMWERGSNWRDSGEYEGDSGSAARFFYCAKASQEDRNEGLEDCPLRSAGSVTDRKDGSDGLNSPRAGAGRTNGSRNHHPTVKPINLARYLCRLVTPPGGVVLDPFAGSGSLGIGAILEGFTFIGIEQEAEYCEIANLRLDYWVAHYQPELFRHDRTPSLPVYDKTDTAQLDLLADLQTPDRAIA